MTPAGQAATHVPQPLHNALITRLTLLLLVELDGVVGAHVVADAAAGAVLFVDRGHDRLDHHLALGDHACMRAAAAAPWATEAGNVLRALAHAGHEHAVGHRGHGVELRVALGVPAGHAARNAALQAQFLGVGLRLQSRPSGSTMSTGMRRCLPSSVSSTWTISLPCSDGLAGGVGHFGHLAADEMHALFQQPLIELLVVLHRRPHVDVERSTPRPWSFPGRRCPNFNAAMQQTAEQ